MGSWNEKFKHSCLGSTRRGRTDCPKFVLLQKAPMDFKSKVIRAPLRLNRRTGSKIEK